MKKTIEVFLIFIFIFMLFGCVQSKEEPTVVDTFEKTSNESIDGHDNDSKRSVLVKYYKMSDKTWKTDDYSYKYRLVLTGRLNNAVTDSTYVVLSNSNDITFEQAWKASGLSSVEDDYFIKKDAVIVEMS